MLEFYGVTPLAAQPTRIHFCGETVPTEQGNVSQKLATALFTSSGYSRHVNALKVRSAPFFAVIEPILEKYQIPADFKFLPIVESAWQANAVSKAGAVGYWQFMDETAHDMGLSTAPGNDERTDLKKSTEAACKYIKALYRELGSWTLVAAAYNGGVGMLQRKMGRQGSRNYYQLALNEETGYYLYRILAMKELFTNPAYYTRMEPGAFAYANEAYEREREQARRMGWLNDSEPEPTGELISSPSPAPGSEAIVMDSLLTTLLKDRPNTPAVFIGDLTTRLTKAGRPTLGQSWAFILTEDRQLGEADLKTGDVLYAVVDDIDANGVIYLRATKAVSAETKETFPLTLLCMNPITGLAGVPLPESTESRVGGAVEKYLSDTIRLLAYNELTRLRLTRT